MLRRVARSLGHLVGILKFCFLFVVALYLPRFFFDERAVPTASSLPVQSQMLVEHTPHAPKHDTKNKLCRHRQLDQHDHYADTPLLTKQKVDEAPSAHRLTQKRLDAKQFSIYA